MNGARVNPPIVITEYDSSWPRTFQALAGVISAELGYMLLCIEHIGSTSVEGLPAKPIIDIDAVVRRVDMELAIERLGKLGYVHKGDLGIKDREAFSAPLGSPAHHLYLCPDDSTEFVRHIRFRDLLRAHLEIASQYASLKKQLAIDFGTDRDGYTQAKSQFIREALAASVAPGTQLCASSDAPRC